MTLDSYFPLFGGFVNKLDLGRVPGFGFGFLTGPGLDLILNFCWLIITIPFLRWHQAEVSSPGQEQLHRQHWQPCLASLLPALPQVQLRSRAPEKQEILKNEGVWGHCRRRALSKGSRAGRKQGWAVVDSGVVRTTSSFSRKKQVESWLQSGTGTGHRPGKNPVQKPKVMGGWELQRVY